jgi:hypothetical protein
MYKAECECGGDLYLIGFKGSCNIPISKDGFYLGDGPCDTEDEVVMCGDCEKTGPLEYTDEG